MSNSKKEKYCELLYNNILKGVIKPITGDQTTYLDEILGAGKYIVEMVELLILIMTRNKKLSRLIVELVRLPG